MWEEQFVTALYIATLFRARKLATSFHKYYKGL